jgi:hypothetical protein
MAFFGLFGSPDSPYSTGSQYTSYVPGDPQFAAGFANPGALATAANAAGRPGTEDLNQTDTSWLSKASSPALVQALQDAAKSSVFNPKDPPPLAAAAIPTGKPGAPARPQSLDALVQFLEKQRAAYGTLSGQPVQRAQTLGLLGF